MARTLGTRSGAAKESGAPIESPPAPPYTPVVPPTRSGRPRPRAPQPTETMTPDTKEREASPVAQAFRRWGHLQARLDPLGRLRPRVHPDLEGAAGDEADRMRAAY